MRPAFLSESVPNFTEAQNPRRLIVWDANFARRYLSTQSSEKVILEGRADEELLTLWPMNSNDSDLLIKELHV